VNPQACGVDASSVFCEITKPSVAQQQHGVGKGGKATLLVDGKPVAAGRVEKTQPSIFSADETADVGLDNQTPVAEGIGVGAETRFTGRIKEVTLEVKPVKQGYPTLQPTTGCSGRRAARRREPKR
jgi:hypothetical protein